MRGQQGGKRAERVGSTESAREEVVDVVALRIGSELESVGALHITEGVRLLKRVLGVELGIRGRRTQWSDGPVGSWRCGEGKRSKSRIGKKIKSMILNDQCIRSVAWIGSIESKVKLVQRRRSEHMRLTEDYKMIRDRGRNEPRHHGGGGCTAQLGDR